MTPPGRPLTGLRVLHVNHRVTDFARTRIVTKALTRAGAEVVNVSAGGRYTTRWRTIARAVRHEPADAVLVGVNCHGDVPVARAAAQVRRVPLLFDAAVSMWETTVENRREASPNGFTARRYLLEDRAACLLADLVLIDTAAHATFFRDRIGAGRTRFARIWLGADDDVMSRRSYTPSSRSRARVFFYSSYSPLHGAEHIVEAAHHLEQARRDVEFVMVGTGGQTSATVRAQIEQLGVRNVTLLDPVPYADLADLMADSDVCLGIFGIGAPAARVIPNKVFDGLAVGRAVVTGDTPAAREALVDGTHCRLCPVGDGRTLAEIIIELIDDPQLTTALAERGHQLFTEQFSIDAIAAALGRAVSELLVGAAGRAVGR